MIRPLSANMDAKVNVKMALMSMAKFLVDFIRSSVQTDAAGKAAHIKNN